MNPSNRTVGPYYNIVQTTTEGIIGLLIVTYQYQLFSILKFDTSAITIYNHYFQSIIKKANLPNSKKQLSIFFEKFIQIFILKRFLDQSFAKQTAPVKSISTELSFTLDDMEIVERLLTKINQLFGTGKFDPFYSRKNKQKVNIEIIFKINKQIDNLLHDLKKTLQNKQQFQRLMKDQYIPEYYFKVDHKTSVIQIMNNFTKIRNCKFLSKKQRQKGIKEFKKTNLNYIPLKIQYQSINQSHKQIKDSYENPISRKGSFITFIKFQSEQCKNLCKLQDYLKGLNDPCYLNLKKNIIKDIIQQSSSYNSKTKSFYPSISLSDIYIDQKTRRCFISDKKLILNGVGFSEDIFSTQMKILYGATPNGIQSQKCHLEYYRIAKIYLDRINQSQHQFDSQEEQKQEQKYFKELQVEEQFQIQQEKMIAKEYEKNIQGFNQNIHVRRLISIFYYILKNQNLNMHLYNNYDEDGKPQNKQQEKPFYLQKYKKIMKKTYQMMKIGDISVPHLLLQGQQNSNSHSKQSAQWSFTIESLKNMYNFKETDSLLEDNAFTRIKSQFYLRVVMLKQISSFLSDDFFKKQINSKINLVIIFIYAMEYFYETKRIINNSKKKKYTRKQIKDSLNFQYKNIYLNSDQLSKTVNKSFNQLGNYSSFNHHAINNQIIFKCMEALQIIQNILQAHKLEDDLRIFDQFFDNNSKNQEEQSRKTYLDQIYHKYIGRMEDLRKFCDTNYRICSDLMAQILKILQQDLQKKKKLHLKYQSFLLKKLIVSLRVYLTLDQYNWNTLKNQFLRLIFQQKQQNKKNKYKKSSELDQDMLNQKMERLDFVLQKFCKESPYRSEQFTPQRCA